MNLALTSDASYLSEYFNDRDQIFVLDGTPRRVIGQVGNSPGETDKEEFEERRRMRNN